MAGSGFWSAFASNVGRQGQNYLGEREQRQEMERRNRLEEEERARRARLDALQESVLQRTMQREDAADMASGIYTNQRPPEPVADLIAEESRHWSAPSVGNPTVQAGKNLTIPSFGPMREGITSGRMDRARAEQDDIRPLAGGAGYVRHSETDQGRAEEERKRLEREAEAREEERLRIIDDLGLAEDPFGAFLMHDPEALPKYMQGRAERNAEIEGERALRSEGLGRYYESPRSTGGDDWDRVTIDGTIYRVNNATGQMIPFEGQPEDVPDAEARNPSFDQARRMIENRTMNDRGMSTLQPAELDNLAWSWAQGREPDWRSVTNETRQTERATRAPAPPSLGAPEGSDLLRGTGLPARGAPPQLTPSTPIGSPAPPMEDPAFVAFDRDVERERMRGKPDQQIIRELQDRGAPVEWIERARGILNELAGMP